MSKLSVAIREIEEKIKEDCDVDVFIKTNNPELGDGYACIIKNTEDKYDVTYLQNRIPSNAWKTEDGIKEAYEINNNGKQYYSHEDSLMESLAAIAEWWGTAIKEVQFDNYVVSDNGIVRLVIELPN